MVKPLTIRMKKLKLELLIFLKPKIISSAKTVEELEKVKLIKICNTWTRVMKRLNKIPKKLQKGL